MGEAVRWVIGSPGVPQCPRRYQTAPQVASPEMGVLEDMRLPDFIQSKKEWLWFCYWEVFLAPLCYPVLHSLKYLFRNTVF